ncbi:SDR family oxidoreductase [Chitinophaga flava]|uniref:Short-chain dehydrogenase/reductase n=1 Tax=Chitinophaga flava TaxID=2259036 RepID=A0A365XSW3_9BACT|nr:SDR family oxidoreductase [Chitinophaga flava]RBL89423.1 short-chain dehydrogenase/reductase [Chitinophaga flava]
MKNKTWYITGASKGLGLALVKKLLDAGYNVAATSRQVSALKAAVGNVSDNQFLPLEVDLTNAQSIDESIAKAHQHFNGLDVIVNNAGFGIGGSAEELTLEEIRTNFEINVFATISVVHSALPYLRQQRSGHIINISSIAGFAPSAGWSLYNAAKFAVTGFTDSLALDIAELGIKATVVMPGAFRTEFLTDSSLLIAKNRIEDYQTVHAVHDRYKTLSGKQTGDPNKAADALIALANDPEPPVRVFLGSDALTRATEKISQMTQALDKNKSIALSTDYNA